MKQVLVFGTALVAGWAGIVVLVALRLWAGPDIPAASIVLAWAVAAIVSVATFIPLVAPLIRWEAPLRRRLPARAFNAIQVAPFAVACAASFVAVFAFWTSVTTTGSTQR